MDQEINKFFELIIGYNGKTWDVNHAKKYENVESYFFHDMQKMIEGQVGYPSILYLMNFMAFLGYCLNYDQNWEVPKDGKEKKIMFENIGKQEDYVYFCQKYLQPINNKYAKLDKYLYDLVRHRLSHVFFTHNFITTYETDDHLKKFLTDDGHPYLCISVPIFFEDTKRSIESAYKQLDIDQNLSEQFKQKQIFILEWVWQLQEILKNMDLDNDNKRTALCHSSKEKQIKTTGTQPPGLN